MQTPRSSNQGLSGQTRRKIGRKSGSQADRMYLVETSECRWLPLESAVVRCGTSRAEKDAHEGNRGIDAVMRAQSNPGISPLPSVHLLHLQVGHNRVLSPPTSAGRPAPHATASHLGSGCSFAGCVGRIRTTIEARLGDWMADVSMRPSLRLKRGVLVGGRIPARIEYDVHVSPQITS